MTGLESFVAAYGTGPLAGAVAAMAAGGFAKGVVGFALPLIALSVAGSFMPYDVAVAILSCQCLSRTCFRLCGMASAPLG